jgi:hypothetical protein
MSKFMLLGMTAFTGLAAGPTAFAEEVATEDRSPVVYVIPMTGQMGTDIHSSIYEEIIEDANEVKPDLIVFQLDSADVDTNFHIQNDDRREFGIWQNIEVYRDMMTDLQNKLPVDLENQVMWIEDAVGPSTLFALSFPNIYMTKDARFWGLDAVQRFADGWSDPDVRAKMYAAWVGIASGFGQAGGYPLELIWAMIEPKRKLGVKFEGRDVVWDNDLAGTYWTIDGNPEAVARFNSDSAENVMLSKGTVRDLDDLMFLLGHREYEVADSGQQMAEKYIEGWRRAFERCESLMKDARDRQAGGTIADLGAAKKAWEKILSAGRRYPAVAARLQQDYGLDLFSIETRIEQMKKQIQDSRRNGRSTGGAGRGGSRGGRGGGLGGG